MSSKIDKVLQQEDAERRASCKQVFKSLKKDADLPDWEGFLHPAKVLFVRGGSGQVHVGDVLRGVFPTLAYLRSRDMRVVLASSPGLEKIFGEWKDTLKILNGNKQPEELAQDFMAEHGEASVKWHELLREWTEKLKETFDEDGRPVVRSSILPANVEQSRMLREDYSEGYQKKVMGIIWRTSMIGRDPNRNASLDDFKDIIKTYREEWNFVSLQYGSMEMTAEELGQFNSKKRKIIFDERIDPMKDYNGAAAQMAACDHIISIDCSQIFQAGAFGVPVSVLISEKRKHDYWKEFNLDEDGICPFFPETARVFTQDKLGEWDSPVSRAWHHAAEDVSRRGAWEHPAAQAVKKALQSKAQVIPLHNVA